MGECKHCEMESHDCEYCCDGAHIDLLEKENQELKAKVEKMPVISQYNKEGCTDRICIDGIYFGYVDGRWQRAKSQWYAKNRYELGLEGGEG